MRRFLVVSMVVLLALFIAVPSFALEVKWGGLFRARVLSQHDFTAYNYSTSTSTTYTTTATGTPPVYTTTATTAIDNTAGNDLSMYRTSKAAERSISYTQHNNRFDQRLRMFIDFISSENLKVVTKFETQAVWGRAWELPAAGRNINTGSGNVGADSGSLNVKNVYVDFNIPQTPLSAKVGVQGISLLDSWIIDSDFSAAMLHANLKPFTVVLGYISGQNFQSTAESENIDDLAAVVAYKEGPFSAALVGVWQDAHNTPASIFPTVGSLIDDPVQINVLASPSADGSGDNKGLAYPNPYTRRVPGLQTFVAQSNQLFDLGIQLGYKIDYLSAYLNFVKNFGSVKLGLNPSDLTTSNYTGWMLDAGFNYFCGPWTFNLGGFYTSGMKVDQDYATNATNGNVLYPGKDDISWFVYPLSTSKYFSEIMGGGILDNTAPNGGYWRGYPMPTNLWTVTAGGAWQVLPQTKLALSWWYFGTAEKVPSRYDAGTGSWKFDNYLGNEIDLNITQNIVDKLNLDLVGAYMFTGDAFRAKTYNYPYNKDDNTYELGARLQWTW